MAPEAPVVGRFQLSTPARISFLTRAHSAGSSLMRPPARPKVDRAELFSRKDRDDDGKLTHEEFMANQPDPKEAPKRFLKFDTDGDGLLTRDEFISAGAKR